jgi:type II secretory pathway component GspD/PulD (secretin)
MPTIIDGTAGITFPNSTVQASAGQVLQVAQVTIGTQTSTTSPTYADTGLTLSITPKFTTSKILVIAYCGMCKKTAVDAQMNIQILRASTSVFVAAALNNDAASTASTNPTISYLDSPSTTSSTQYKIQVANRDGVGTMNFNNNGTATLTLMEIAA